MSEFELRLKYTNRSARAAVHFLALLFPLWGVLGPTTLVLFIILLLKLPANIPIAYALILIAFIFAVIALCAAVALICDDDEIRVNKMGMRFPLKFLPSLKFKMERSWEELVSLRLHWKRNETFASDETLDFIFQDGGYARLILQDIKLEELEQFFIAFESCAYKCERDAELPDFEQSIQKRKLGNLYSFTDLWEKSLADKFSGATFVPLEPNEMLASGRYQILRQLAFGGFSAVYLARPAAGGFVVLKESAPPKTEEIENKAPELFAREAALLAKLDHPNIARVLDYFVENGRYYIAMQHVEGIDLGRLVLKSGPKEPQAVINLLRQLATTLQYLHEQSPAIVHRDITPDNLLLKPDGSLVVIDFGAAKEIVTNFTGTIIGKQGYMAPEQFKGKPSTKSDVYSLGATAHFLLTGKQPQAFVQSRPSDFRETVPEELNKLVMQCTEQDENARPNCATIIDALTAKTSVVVGQE